MRQLGRLLIDLLGVGLILTALWMFEPIISMLIAGVAILFFNREV